MARTPGGDNRMLGGSVGRGKTVRGQPGFQPCMSAEEALKVGVAGPFGVGGLAATTTRIQLIEVGTDLLTGPIGQDPIPGAAIKKQTDQFPWWRAQGAPGSLSRDVHRKLPAA